MIPTKTIAALILLALFSVRGFAANGLQWNVTSSVFATYGNYSNGTLSNDYAGYVNVGIRRHFMISLAYENLALNQQQWDYKQQMGIIGGSMRLPSAIIKAYYGHIQGKLQLADFDNSYHDKTDFGNAELIYVLQDQVWLGMAVTHLQGNLGSMDNFGVVNHTTTNTRQYTGRVEWLEGRRFLLSIRPTYVWLNDGRNLFSMSFKAHYQPFPRVLIKAGGIIGDRAYYFDNDLLTIYNQNGTQIGMTFAQGEFLVWKNLTVIGEFIQTQFEDYSINYAVAALRYSFR